jgi:hypothetical protein
LEELIFKSSDAALDYVEKYFPIGEFKKNVAFIGVIRFKEEGEPPIYGVEVNVKSGFLFKKVRRATVLGSPHPDLGREIEVGDLVIWGFDGNVKGHVAGWVIEKLEPTLNLQTNEFQKAPKKRSKGSEKSDWTLATLIFANELIGHFDEDIVKEKYTEKEPKMNNLVSRYKTFDKELLKFQPGSDVSSLFGGVRDLQKDILNSNMIYRFEDESWVLESGYRALEKFGANYEFFGPMHGQHIMYPKAEGVGLRNGYFLYRESTDGEGYSIEFYKRENEEQFKRTVVFNFGPYSMVTDKLQSRMINCCKENGLPMITKWDPIIITMGWFSQHLKSVETVDGFSDYLSIEYISKSDLRNASDLWG